MTRVDYLHALLFVGVSLIAGTLGGVATAAGTREWYPMLTQPTFTPPNWLFSVVWPVLYILMGIAAWRVWRLQGWRGARVPLRLFFAQLAINVAWPVAFFGLRSPGLGLVVILLLIVAILATIAAFLRLDRVAGALLFPYLAWVLFAAALNFEFLRLNP